MLKKLLIAIIASLACAVAGAATIYQSSSTTAEPVVQYGIYGSTLTPIKVDVNGAIYLNGASSNTIGGWTTVAPYTYLTNSGYNVGLGTSTPSQKLEVNGGIAIDGNLYPQAGNLTFWGGTGIGIGTNNPRTTLDVNGTIYGSLIGINTLSPSAKIDVINSGSQTLLNLGTTTTGDAVTVTSSGNVGIGSTSPLGKLEVNGSIYADAGIYVNGLTVISGNTVCYGVNGSGKYLYVKSTCP